MFRFSFKISKPTEGTTTATLAQSETSTQTTEIVSKPSTGNILALQFFCRG